MAISAKEVNELRKMTGAGMMDCKKALTEAEGDFERAIELLRKKGQKVSASRQDRATSEGAIFAKINDAGNEGFAFSLQCETDFVAKNDDFQNLGNEIATLIDQANVNSIEEILSLEMNGMKLSEALIENMGKIGEKIEIGSFERTAGEKVVPYVHGSKLGVLVAMNNTNGNDVSELGKDIAMQIAAMNPVAVNESDVDATILEKEKALGIEQAREEGKPENIVEKIAEGKVKKFLQENTLLAQKFVKDGSKTVSQILQDNGGVEVATFKRVTIG